MAKKTVKKSAGTATKTNSKTGLDLIRKLSLKGAGKVSENFRSGDTVNVFVKVREGEKERIQVYKGLVTKVQGAGASRSFTVRKISAGVGVERTFPFLSPAVDKVEVLNRGFVRRSRLYYLRSLEGKAAKIDSELVGAAESAAAAATTEA